MTDQNQNPIASELRQAERLESVLTQVFAAMHPPVGACERLLAKLDDSFHESELTLNDTGPYSFEEAAQFEKAQTDLLAAGLEEQEIEDDDEDQD